MLHSIIFSGLTLAILNFNVESMTLEKRRFDQEKPTVLQEISDLNKIAKLTTGRFEQIHGGFISTLLAGADACARYPLIDDIISICKANNCEKQGVEVARKLAALEKNFNPFGGDTAKPAFCKNSSLPASAEVKCIVPVIDPGFGGAQQYNQAANSRLEQVRANAAGDPGLCSGKSVQEQAIALGVSDCIGCNIGSNTAAGASVIKDVSQNKNAVSNNNGTANTGGKNNGTTQNDVVDSNNNTVNNSTVIRCSGNPKKKGDGNSGFEGNSNTSKGKGKNKGNAGTKGSGKNKSKTGTQGKEKNIGDNGSSGNGTSIDNGSAGNRTSIDNGSSGNGTSIDNGSAGNRTSIDNGSAGNRTSIDNGSSGNGTSIDNGALGNGTSLENGSSGNGTSIDNGSSGNGTNIGGGNNGSSGDAGKSGVKNVNLFTGALLGAPPVVVNDLGEKTLRRFQVLKPDGSLDSDFLNKNGALVRACVNQKNACATIANGSGGSKNGTSVSDCEKQDAECRQANGA